MEFREPIKKINNKNVFKKIVEFLISDYYMYASLVAPQSIVTPTGTFPSKLFLFILFKFKIVCKLKILILGN